MNNQVNFALVGLFVLVLGGAFAGLSLWLGFSGDNRAYTHYVTYFEESVTGLNVKAAVKYRGVEVGRVKRIELDRDNPSRVRVELEIESGTPIKTDTKAVLSSQGLTGIAHVELGGGSAGGDLDGGGENDPVEIRTGQSLFVRLDTAVSTLLDEMKEAVGHLSAVAERTSLLMENNNIEIANQTLENVRRLTDSLARNADSLSITVDNVNQMSGDALDMSAEIPQLITQVRETLAAFDTTAVAISRTADTLSTMAIDARSDLKEIAQDALPEVSAVLTEVRQLAQTLNRLAEQLERDPSLLLRGRSTQQLGPGE